MKKLFVLLAGSLFVVSNAKAVDSTGCGLGSTLLKGQKGPVYQILAVTTNGTSATQTFGITSGTLGCDPDGRITGGTGKVLVFLENNLDAFALDVAKGEGETINSLASILGKDSKEVSKILNNNFEELFSKENINVVEVSEKVATLLSIA